MSLDGFVAGTGQSVKNHIGHGGMGQLQWVFPLKAWRERMGMPGGEANESSRVIEESLVNIGATVMGRNMFGGQPGPWDHEDPRMGWWGDNQPFGHPVFVLTHHAREPLVLKGGTTFHFVTGGANEALLRAREAAAGKDISLAGGAN